MQEIDQKSAIMTVIEHLGDIPAGTKCSAVFCDNDRVRREQEFHAKLYDESGVKDPDTIRAMVAANVPSEPYWLVSLKVPSEQGDVVQYHRIDARTGKIIPNPA